MIWHSVRKGCLTLLNNPSQSVLTYLNRIFRTREFGTSDSVGLILVVTFIIAVLGMSELAGDPLRSAWSLDRGVVLDGQGWRMASAHLVHLSRAHTVINILALVLVSAALWTGLTTFGLIRSILYSGLAISVGWVALQPSGFGYAGFSGITHGIFTFGTLVILWRGPFGFGLVLMFCIALKLSYEFAYGAVPGVEAEIGGSVALMAHALGAFGGAVTALRCSQTWVCMMFMVFTAILAVSHAEPQLIGRAVDMPTKIGLTG